MQNIDTLRLDQALVTRGLVATRTEAQELIDKGLVCVNNEVCTKQIRKISGTDILEVKGRRTYVSRGGEKLIGALIHVYSSKENSIQHLKGKIALDVGSSTGGFTDCLLQNGVRHVDAVDVGTAQAHISLLSDNRVSLFENTDIRFFRTDKEYDIIVADLSFISLQGIIDTIKELSNKNTECFLLIKPQFEVGKGNTKKGIVKDIDLVKRALSSLEEKCLSIGAKNIQMFPCIIQGGDGNQEYFVYFSY